MTNPHIGSSFDDFLKEEGIYEEVTATAIKRVIAWQLEQSRLAQGISKSELARQMRTSRTQIDRLLDPTNTQVQLDTLQRAAEVLGHRLSIELI
jgi:DNA-binding Xre family transcriptional regulator